MLVSDCCNAYVTFFDSTLVCKKCYKEQGLETLTNE
jgi:hypothetical protein